MKADNVTISIVIPCYNDGPFLLEAIQSTEQILDIPHEVIVVNDGSTDPFTREVLLMVEQKHHKVIHQPNGGLGRARNRGISDARGRYILPLDADNRILSTYVERGVAILDREPGVDVVYGDAEYFGDKTGRKNVPKFNIWQLLEWNYIDACAVFRKSAWHRCGGYDESMPTQGFEDWDLWCRIALSGGRFHHVDEVLFQYRVRNNSMSSGMATPERVSSILRHIRSKKIEVSIGDFLEAYHSQGPIVTQLHRRPFRTIVDLLLRSFVPKQYCKLKNRIHARLRKHQATTSQ